VIAGPSSKQILVRAVGPGLTTTFGLPGTLAAPQLGLLNLPSGTLVASNSGWSAGATPAATFSQLFAQFGAFPLTTGSADAAVLATLPGNISSYSAQIAGLGTANGIVTAEVYDVDIGSPSSRLINVSARANVGTGNSILIGGFAIGGTSSETVLIRAIGPGLTSTFGLTGTMAHPTMTLYDSVSQPVTLPIATNTGWGGTVVAGNSPVAAGIQAATNAAMASVGAYSLVDRLRRLRDDRHPAARRVHGGADRGGGHDGDRGGGGL